LGDCYSIDTSAILDGWIRYYPPDVFPEVWDRIDKLIESGRLIATEEVLEEIKRKDDDVLEWAEKRRHMFVPIDEDIQRVVKAILKDHPKLIDERKGRSGADPFVIALAKIRGCHVVTGEFPTGGKKRPKIPDVCNAFGIRSFNLLEMFRRERFVFGH